MLAKGDSVSLSKQVPGLTAVTVGVSWELHENCDNEDLAFELSALLCDERKRVLSDHHFFFYNNFTAPDNSIHLRADDIFERPDFEVIEVKLAALEPTVASIVFAVSVCDIMFPKLTFREVKSLYIRVLDYSEVDYSTHLEFVRYVL